MFGHFARHEGGNIATVMALAVMPLMIAVGGAIDYSRASSAREHLQAATDSATISRTTDARNGTAMATIGTQIKAQVIAQTNDPNVTLPNNPTMSSDGTTMCVDTTSYSTNMFMNLVRVSTLPISAHSCTTFNLDSFEIAVVVDNSGSMANSALNGQTKMQAAITAANNLVTAMSSTPPGVPRTAFSVVPFSSSVNVGQANAAKPFMDTTGKSSFHFKSFQMPSGASWLPTSKFQMNTLVGSGWYGCVEERPAPYMTSDTAANSSTSWDTLYVPFFYPDENDSNQYSIVDYLDDNGGSCTSNDVYYQADRNNTSLKDGQSKVCKYKNGVKKSGNSLFGTGYPLGPNVTCTVDALTPLTTDTTIVTNAINGMSAAGDTNIMTGVMWGWRTISPNGPFNASAGALTVGPQVAKSYGYTNAAGGKNHKVLVLLTDGDNHWGGQAGDSAIYGSDHNGSAYSAFGFFAENRIGGSTKPTTAANAYSQMNAITLEACTNAKAAGIEIYTVGVTASDGISSAGQSLLLSCATTDKPGEKHAYVAADGAELIAAFQKIANSMSNLRVSR